jgi:hypothetical protein
LPAVGNLRLPALVEHHEGRRVLTVNEKVPQDRVPASAPRRPQAEKEMIALVFQPQPPHAADGHRVAAHPRP